MRLILKKILKYNRKDEYHLLIVRHDLLLLNVF